MHTIVFFGDSITQQGNSGNGFIAQLRQQLSATDYQLIGAGIGGNKVYDLYLRLERDVLLHEPYTTVILIGINDIWHKEKGIGVDIVKYEQFYRAIIEKLLQHQSKVILCTLTVIGERTNQSNPMDADLEAYSQVVTTLASDYQITCVALRQIFTQYLQIHNTTNAYKGILTTDGVHLNTTGNTLVATALLPLLQQLSN